jgi:mannose-6-phosphate isomerase
VVTPRGGFPLLIKYLDARENLSLQVHPSADYAVNHPGSYTKSEAWVIVEAEPGSVIYKGLRPGLTRDELRRHIESGRIVDDLIKVPALAGDCHYLPSGTCHALGAGVLVAEVQTPSDTTFRLYDWGRTGRALHIEEALRCIDFSAGVDKLHNRDRVPIVTSEFVTEGLCEAECFTIERVSAVPGSDLPVVTGNAPVVWMIISGAGVVRTPEAAEGSESVAFATGTTMLMPATIAHSVARFHRKTAFLKVGLPSFIRDFLA